MKVFSLLAIFYCFGAFATLPINFQYFSSWEEAKELYVEKYEKTVNGGYSRPILPKNAPEYSKAKSKVTEITKAFKAVYPELNQIRRNPRIIILDVTSDNAAIPAQIGTEAKPFIVTIHKGLLRKKDSQIDGVLAHELAHLYLQWRDEEGVHPQVKTYQVQYPERFKFSDQIAHSESLAKDFSEWTIYQYYAGPFSHAGLEGNPLQPGGGTESIFKLITDLSYGSDCQEEFYTVMAKAQVGGMVLQDKFGLLKSSGYKFEEDMENLFSYTDELNEGFHECLEGKKMEYYELMANSFNIPAEKIKNLLEPSFSKKRMEVHRWIEHQFINHEIMPATNIVLRKLRSEMRELESRMDPRTIRTFNHEDHADEVAVKILNHMGKTIDGLNDFLTAGKRCPKKTEEIVYKKYDDLINHPNSCWRALRNESLQSQL